MKKTKKKIKYKREKLSQHSEMILDFLAKDFENLVDLIKEIMNLKKK